MANNKKTAVVGKDKTNAQSEHKVTITRVGFSEEVFADMLETHRLW